MAPPRAEPFYFGPAGRRCFGWLHRPDPAEARALGLVIGGPFGHELAPTHRSLRHFAESAAAHGVPALRFDYHGTGDSPGGDLDPDRAGAWIAGVQDAIDELRGRTGVTRVAFLGLRLGATLGALATSTRRDVVGFVAIAPVVSGKAWLREMRVLEMMTGFAAAPDGEILPEGSQEVLGYVLTPETRTAIGAMNLLSLDAPPAPEVLIIGRDDLPTDPDLANGWEALGASVTRSEAPGYASMMKDAHEAEVPEAMISLVADWLGKLAPRKEAPVLGAVKPRAVSEPEPVAPGVLEVPVFLDDECRMFGILSRPTGARSKLGILLLNSGANPRLGPNRQYVMLARRWAAKGHVVLRMDQGGIGDSLPRPGEAENVVYAGGAVDDVDAAVAWLRREGEADEVMAAGICSGAYHALRAAVAGVPVAAVGLVNPLVYRWKAGMSLAYPSYQVSQAVAQYRRSLFQVAKWRKLLSGKVDLTEVWGLMSRRAAARSRGFALNLARGLGLRFREDLGKELQVLAQRGVAIRFTFASGDPGDDLLSVEAGWALRGLIRTGAVRIRRIPGPNHSFTPAWTQAALAEALDEALQIP